MRGFLLVSGDQVDIEDAVAGWRSMSPATRDSFIIFAAVIFVSLLILIWAIFIRKPGQRRRIRRSHSSEKAAPEASAVTVVPQQKAESETQSSGRRRRRRRREHRPRNPTLAETGGLPPVRQEPASEPPQ